MDWEDALERELHEQLEDPQSDQWMKQQRHAVYQTQRHTGISEQLKRHSRMLQHLVDQLEVHPDWMATAGEIEGVVKALKGAIRAAEEAEYER